jgi:hypothetical protein
MAGTQPKKKARGKAYQWKLSFRSFACTTEEIKRRTRSAMKASRWHKEKARTRRENEPSGQANGAVVTPMQQGVQHLNKYGGMAGTTAENWAIRIVKLHLDATQGKDILNAEDC